MINLSTLLLTLSFSSISIASTVFTPVTTIDGIHVNYIPKSSEEIAISRQSVAYAIYDKYGAAIYYDYELFNKIESFSKFLIIEHERAHHLLGHTLSTKEHREAKKLIPANIGYRKEIDADCEAGFRAAEEFKTVTALDINNAMLAIYIANGGDPNNKPEWLINRTSKVITCFEGLVSRPLPFEQ